MEKETEMTRSERPSGREESAEKMCKNFNQPDETRPFKGHGHLDILKFEGGTTIGRAIFEPGWKWSTDVKPIAETESCESAHTGYCVEGEMRIAMDDGQEFTIQAGDAFKIPPGHDAWVEGSQPCVMIDVTGYEHYAEEKGLH